MNNICLIQVQCDSCFWWLHYECSGSVVAQDLMASQSYVCPLCTPFPDAQTSEPADEFILTKRTGRHKVCRGCGLIKEKNVPPYDFLLRHKETYSYYDKASRQMKQTVGNRFYHVNMDCLKAAQVDVTSIALTLLNETKQYISVEHKLHFWKCGISFHY